MTVFQYIHRITIKTYLFRTFVNWRNSSRQIFVWVNFDFGANINLCCSKISRRWKKRKKRKGMLISFSSKLFYRRPPLYIFGNICWWFVLWSSDLLQILCVIQLCFSSHLSNLNLEPPGQYENWRCDALQDLLPFVQFEKREKLLHGCFSSFLNFANGTKSRNASHMHKTFRIRLERLKRLIYIEFISSVYGEEKLVPLFEFLKLSLTFTCSKSTIETLEKAVKYVQS